MRETYTRGLCAGEEADDIEQWLNREFESPAKGTISKSTRRQRSHAKRLGILIRFLASQIVRTPAVSYKEPANLESDWHRWYWIRRRKTLKARLRKAKESGHKIVDDDTSLAEYFPIKN